MWGKDLVVDGIVPDDYAFGVFEEYEVVVPENSFNLDIVSLASLGHNNEADDITGREEANISYSSGRKFRTSKKKRVRDGMSTQERLAWEKQQIEEFLSKKGGPTKCPSRYAAGAVPEQYWTEV